MVVRNVHRATTVSVRNYSTKSMGLTLMEQEPFSLFVKTAMPSPTTRKKRSANSAQRGATLAYSTMTSVENARKAGTSTGVVKPA